MRYHSLFCAVVCSLVWGAAQCNAQYSHFLATPRFLSPDIDTFQQLFRSASSGGLRIAMFGDSQETSNGGGGRFYLPALNLEFNLHYENTPESNVAFARSYAAEWLLGGSDFGVSSTQVSGSNLLPSQRVGRFGNAPSHIGLLAQLNLDATNTPDINSEALEFNTQNVEVQLIGRGFEGSSEIDWRINVNPTDFRGYFGGTNIASGVTAMGLGSSVSGQYHTESIGVFSVPDGNRAIQVILSLIHI